MRLLENKITKYMGLGAGKLFTAIAVIALISLVAFKNGKTLLLEIKESIEGNRPLCAVKEIERRFTILKKHLPPHGVVGYVTSKPIIPQNIRIFSEKYTKAVIQCLLTGKMSKAKGIDQLVVKRIASTIRNIYKEKAPKGEKMKPETIKALMGAFIRVGLTVSDFFPLQYFLAPVILERGINHPLIVGNLPSITDIKTFMASKNLGLILDCGNGTYLFRPESK